MYYPHQSKFILIDNNWKKETENPNPQWPQAALLFTNSASKIIWIFWVWNRKKKRLKKNILTIYIVNDASNVKDCIEILYFKICFMFVNKVIWKVAESQKVLSNSSHLHKNTRSYCWSNLIFFEGLIIAFLIWS